MRYNIPMLNDIIKRSELFHTLQEQVLSKKLSNVLLFRCEDEILLSGYLKLLCQLLLCDKFCGQCSICKQIEAGTYLDVHIYPKTNAKLKVDDSEKIVEESFVKPIEGAYKIFLINLDDATEEAQNKLLKILEEAPISNYYFLTTSSEESVLPTIRSRANKITIPSITDDEQFINETENIAFKLAGGNYSKMNKYLALKDFEKILNISVSVFSQMKNSKQLPDFYHEITSSKVEFSIYLEIFAQIVQDLLNIKSNNEKYLKLPTFVQDLKNCINDYSYRALIEISKDIILSNKKLKFNANVNLVIENFLLNILESKYIWK